MNAQMSVCETSPFEMSDSIYNMNARTNNYTEDLTIQQQQQQHQPQPYEEVEGFYQQQSYEEPEEYYPEEEQTEEYYEEEQFDNQNQVRSRYPIFKWISGNPVIR